MLLFGGMIASWETAEVMVLRQLDEVGEPFETRLWVIPCDEARQAGRPQGAADRTRKGSSSGMTSASRYPSQGQSIARMLHRDI